MPHEHYQAVESRRDSSVRRRAELERLDEEAERLLRALLGVADNLEDALLKGWVVDTH